MQRRLHRMQFRPSSARSTVVLDAYDATVFSERHLSEHAQFVEILLRTGIENHRSLGYPYRKD